MTRLLMTLARSFVVGLSIMFYASVMGVTTADAQSLTPPRQYSISPTNVNLLDNTYAISVEDLSIGSLKLERSYLGGRETSSHYFGSGWTHNFDLKIASAHQGGTNPTVTAVIGRTKYVFGGTPTSNSPQIDEYGTSLTQVGGVNIFTDRDGTVYRFASGASSDATITAPDGSVTTITYVSSKPKIVRSNRGYAIVFDYDSNGNVSAACGFNLTNFVVSTSTTCASATLKTSYAYASGNLVAATNVVGSTAHYSYTSSPGGLACLTDPGTTVCKVTNTYQVGQYHITQQTMGDGTVWQFNCSCSFDGKDDSADSFPDDDSGWTDPTGHGMGFEYHGGVMTYYLDGNSQRYNTGFIGRYPTFVGLPETNSVAFGYTDRMMPNTTVFHAKSGSSLGDIGTDTKVYPSSCSNIIVCNKPTSVTDANGNVTAYSYDSTHGGVLTETMPSNGAGLQAVMRHSYIQRYAWILSGSTYVHAASPIWLLLEDRMCRASATVGNACAAGATDEVVTSYDYGPDSGPNTLLLRGKVVTADGISLRTCYGYDWQGNKTSETSPRAGLASCS